MLFRPVSLLQKSEILLLKKDCNHQGFTLIELLVVTIILGILAAISIPNLIANIGKARETEATTNLGALARSQQAYHFETQQFASSISNLDQNISITSKYYDFPDPSIANVNLVKQQAIAISPWSNGSRNHAFGVYHNSGYFDSIFCRAKGVFATVEAPDTSSGSCSNGGVEIK